MIIGVAGKYCSGKSTVTGYLVRKGFREIDLDAVGHAALKEAACEVAEAFGRGVLDHDGAVDRRKLGDLVFGDETRRLRLEAILHPRMIEMTEARVKELEREDIVIDGALLFYMGVDRLCDCAFWVSAPFPVRLRRASRRDNLPFFTLLKRFRSQRHLSPQPSSKDVDIYYIRNTGSPAALRERLDHILRGRGYE